MLQHGKIRIENVTGEIEITATKNLGTYIVKGGKLINNNFNIVGRSDSVMNQKDGYVELVLAAVDYQSPGVYWELKTEGKKYSKLICRLSNPSWSGSVAAGGYIFAGNGVVTGDAYANSGYAYAGMGGNGFGPFGTPLEFKTDFNGDPETFYIGIQMYCRYASSWWRGFQLYDFILVE